MTRGRELQDVVQAQLDDSGAALRYEATAKGDYLSLRLLGIRCSLLGFYQLGLIADGTRPLRLGEFPFSEV